MVRVLWASIAILLLGATVGVATVERPVAERSLSTTSGNKRTPDLDLPVDVPGSLPVLPTLPALPDVPKVTLPTIPTTLPRPPVSLRSDVFYVQPTSDPHVLDRYDWAGKHRGRITLDDHADTCGDDGSTLNGAYFEVCGAVYDKSGAFVIAMNPIKLADDNAHACNLSFTRTGQSMSEPYWLSLLGFDGSSRHVAMTPTPTQTDVGGAQLLACNVLRDRALVYVNNPPERQTFSIRFSDGAVTRLPAQCDNGGGGMPSLDGHLYAAHTGADQTTICDLDLGKAIATVPIAGGFSGDGSLLYTSEYDECPWRHGFIAYDWRTRARVWSSDELPKLDCQHGWWLQRMDYATNAMVFQETKVNDGSEVPGQVWLARPGFAPVKVTDASRYARVF